MSKEVVTPKVDLEDVYSLLSDIHARVCDVDERLKKFENTFSELSEKLPEALNNPMLKPFVKMLGLG